MANTTATLAELLYPGIKKIFGEEYKPYDAIFSKLFEQVNSTQAFEKVQGVTSYPVAALKDQGKEITFLDMFQGYQKEFRHLTYGIGATITRELVEDDQYNVIKRVPKMLSRSLSELQEITHANVFNNGFTTFTGPDGSPFFSSTHTLVNNSLGSNTPAIASDLTQTSLQQAIIDIAYFRDDQGKRINLKAKKLHVPSDLFFTASEILQTQYQTGTNNNNINVISKMVIELVDSNYLTDTDAWFVITDADAGLMTFNRRKPELGNFSDDRTENANFKVTTRFSYGFADWRCGYGSAGA